MFRTKLIIVTLFLMPAFSWRASDQPYIAYSLREAQNLAKSGSMTNHELLNLGGITRIVGFVHDREGKDIILVGRKLDGLPKAHLDDLVTALRAKLLHPESPPMVSIDPLPTTLKTYRQKVNFGGGIAETQFGKDLLDSDIILKNYSLEQIAMVDEVNSYNWLCLNNIEKQIKIEGAKVVSIRWLPTDSSQKLHGKRIQTEASLQTRFWFYPLDPTHFIVRDGLFYINELRLCVLTEFIYTDTKGKKTADQLAASSGKIFAKQFTEHLPKVAKTYPVLKRLKILYDLVAVSEGIKNFQDRPDFSYFIKQYRVSPIHTSEDHDFIQLCALVERSDSLQQIIQISGGIEFEAELKWLNSGDVSPLRDIVLKSRPKIDALTWHLPLDNWQMSNTHDLEQRNTKEEKSVKRINKSKGVGTSIITQYAVLSTGNSIRNEKAKEFSGFQSLPSASPLSKLDLGGIDIAIKLAFEKATIDTLRNKVLKSRPSDDSLFWNIEPPKKKAKP